MHAQTLTPSPRGTLQVPVTGSSQTDSEMGHDETPNAMKVEETGIGSAMTTATAETMTEV